MTDVAGRIGAILVMIVTVVSVTNAVLRYGFHLGSNAWLEIQILLFAAVIYLGGAQTLKLNEHIRVDVIYSNLSERTCLLVDIFGFLVFFLPVTTYLTYVSFLYFNGSFQSGEVSGNTGGLLLWPVKIAIPVGFALLTLQGISELIKRIAALKGLTTANVNYEKPLQ